MDQVLIAIQFYASGGLLQVVDDTTHGNRQVHRFTYTPMVGEMVQNSQSLYAFTINVLIDIHEYIYSHSITEFTF